jgi:hypothetical protein
VKNADLVILLISDAYQVMTSKSGRRDSNEGEGARCVFKRAGLAIALVSCGVLVKQRLKPQGLQGCFKVRSGMRCSKVMSGPDTYPLQSA